MIWCKLWGMKLNANKTQRMIVSRSRTLVPNHPDLSINNVILQTCESFKILGIEFDSKFTFEQHIRTVSSSVAQKLVCLESPLKFLETNLF